MKIESSAKGATRDPSSSSGNPGDVAAVEQARIDGLPEGSASSKEHAIPGQQESEHRAVEHTTQKVSRVRQVERTLLLIGALAAAGIAAWVWMSRTPPASSPELILYGNVDIRQVNLAFNGSDRIATMHVREGENVRKGQLLATLDTQRLERAVVHQEAQGASAAATLARLEAGSRPEEIRKARAEVDAAMAEARNAKRNAQRLRGLLAKDMVTQEEADNATAIADASTARLRAAQETLKLAIEGPRTEDIEAARQTLGALRAQLALTKREFADASLSAPANGIIQDRLLEPGDMATPQSPLYTLALMDPVWVRAYATEPDLGKLRQGMIAFVSTDSYPNKRYQAWVGFISPTAEFTPKSVETSELRTHLVYQVRVYACNPQNELRLGMPATVLVPLDQQSPALGADEPDVCTRP